MISRSTAGIEHPHLAPVGRLVERRGQRIGRRRADPAQRHHVASDFYAEFVEQPAGEGAGGHPGRRLPGAGALEDVPRVQPVVLEHAHQVGVARAAAGSPGGGGSRLPPSGDMTSSQLLQSRFGMSIATGLPRVSPARMPGEPLHPVALDLHPRAAAVALHPPREVAVDPVGRNGQSRGKPLDDGDEGLAVGLSCRGEPQSHPGVSPSSASKRARRAAGLAANACPVL